MIASSERRGTAPVEGRNVAVAPVVFRLAPMSTGLRVLTWVLMTLPCGMLCGALVVPFPGNVVLYATAAFTLLTYAGVWFMGRPSRFEVDASTLRIIWPIRTRDPTRAHRRGVRRRRRRLSPRVRSWNAHRRRRVMGRLRLAEDRTRNILDVDLAHGRIRDRSAPRPKAASHHARESRSVHRARVATSYGTIVLLTRAGHDMKIEHVTPWVTAGR